jgi:hypothetical protein
VADARERVHQPLADQRDVRRVLLLDLLPAGDRIVVAMLLDGDVAELDQRPDVLPVDRERIGERGLRIVGP